MDKRELRRMFSAQPGKFYNAQVLEKAGFERRKCPKCGDWFWSLGKETCGDTGCEGGYSFLGKTDLGWDFLTALEKWERFFNRNHHKLIEPYPLVARWREDLHFVIASIADFQPWVLQGIAEPPGNPLAVSQPCLRFNDLDNVGRTGRHFSMFFMGGQHAFDLHDYWVDETLGFGFRFLKEALRIPAEEITYKEDVWSGGGNFGPSMEAFAHGLEIVNHVFMQFEEHGDSYREMDMRVVDTGWGLERVAWYASGRANNYEAVFPLSAKYRKDLELDVDFSDPMWGEMGLYDVNESGGMPKEFRQKLRELRPLQDLYTVLDHTRALTFSLADGAIPSNVGGGHNLRLLLRRVFSILESRGWDLTPELLIKEHARYYSRRFDNMKNMPDVEDIVGVERRRYEKTMRKGKELVKKHLDKGDLPDKLTELYESHGVQPEMARDMAEAGGQELEVPEDFYKRLEEKGKPGAEEEEKGARRDLPETEPLYYSKRPEERFKTQVLWSSGKEVVLKETSFYPTGGGQAHDTGTLKWKDHEAKVVGVEREGKATVHRLDRKAPKVGTKVEGRVDAKRRRAIMRHHTAVHLVNGAAQKVLGKHVWQAGADKTPEKARLDITHYKSITPEEVREMELVANRAVLENLKVRVRNMTRTKAEQKFGFRIYQGGAVPGAKLRIIHVPGYDAEACGGVHCDYTGEVGTIRIINTKRIQDGVVRLELIAGMRSLERSWEKEELMEEAAEAAGSRVEDLGGVIRKLQRRIKRLLKADVKVELHGDKVKWAVTDMPFRQMENVMQEKLEESGAEALVAVSKVDGGVLALSRGEVSALELAREVSKKHGADAGGDGETARGGARELEGIGNTLEKAAKKFGKPLD